MRNRYLSLRARIIRLMLSRGLLGPRKLANAARCYAAKSLRSPRSGAAPVAVSFELSNECNANCVFCRSERGEIYDGNPDGKGFLEKGEMPFELYCRAIDELAPDLAMAILYVNGEPFLYRRLFDAVRYASDRKVATMISTNGIALTLDNARRLLDSGICFVKVALSGFSQGTYRREVRKGDVERIKENVAGFQGLNRETRSGAVVMLDFMIYEYNTHEVEEARAFCQDLGILFNVRPGNTRNMEVARDFREAARSGSVGLCAWPWTMLTVNWNGDVCACCDYTVWKGAPAVGRIDVEGTRIRELWNGEEYRRIRKLHARVGRKAFEVCRDCRRTGSAFKD